MQSLVLATLQGTGSSYKGGTVNQNSFIPLCNSAGVLDPSFIITSAPSTSSSSGVAGQIAYDSSYIYVCTATNVWRRAATSSF